MELCNGLGCPGTLWEGPCGDIVGNVTWVWKGRSGPDCGRALHLREGICILFFGFLRDQRGLDKWSSLAGPSESVGRPHIQQDLTFHFLQKILSILDTFFVMTIPTAPKQTISSLPPSFTACWFSALICLFHLPFIWNYHVSLSLCLATTVSFFRSRFFLVLPWPMPGI